MSRDPFQERETEKYTNPIPGREFILEYLTKREKPTSRGELAVGLYIEGEEQPEDLRRRLRVMERDGQLVFTRRQYYMLPERLDLAKGTVIGHRDGYGFLRVEERKGDLYLSNEQMKTCIHDSQVLVQLLGVDHKGHREARIVHVLVPKTSQIVDRYFTEMGVGFMVPDDSRLNSDILIPPDQIVGARIGFVVVVGLTQRSTHRTKAVGKVVEVLDDSMGAGMAADTALRTHEIPYIWPQAVEQQAVGLREEVPEEAKVDRVDLRDLSLVTIDDGDARGFDDAVYCEKKRGGGWHLRIAVTDVSYYVCPLTLLDREACNRGTSVYFPSQVIPMLPEVLSNGLCSLNPQVDRLCMACKMAILLKGHLTDYKFYEAVMSSYTRLTYTKVWHILQGDRDLREQYAPLVKHLEESYSLCKVLDRAREERGGISFESGKAKFIFNAEHRVGRIEQAQHNDAHKLIEECMILADISATCFVRKAKESALFRIHDKPNTGAITFSRSVLTELGLELPGGDKPELHDYVELLEPVADRPDVEMLQTTFLRSMKQAIYDPGDRGHFGLALQSYAYFISPIHRYPGSTLHRTIKYLLAKERGHQGSTTETDGCHYSMEEVLQLGQHCSVAEHRANEATHDVSNWLKCDFMLDQVGNVSKGVILSVTGFGLFARLDDLFIDGLVHISSLDNDYYRFDQVGQRLVDESSSQTYHLGDHVEVRVEAVDMGECKINFSLISSECAPCNISRTAREKVKKDNVDKKGGKRRQVGKKVDFEPDSALHGEKKPKPRAAKKDARKAEKPSVKTRKIAAAVKAGRAVKKKATK